MISVCKDCPERYPACHDHCDRFKAWKKEQELIKAREYEMTHLFRVCHSDSEDKKRQNGKKRYFGKNGGADSV